MNIYRVTVMRSEVFQIHVAAENQAQAWGVGKNHEVLNEHHPKMKSTDVVEVTDIVAEDVSPDFEVGAHNG